MITHSLPESYKLDPEEKSRWLEALRSGEYKQATGYLRRDGKYCCLGVFLDLVDSSFWGEDPESDTWGPGREKTGLPDYLCYDGDALYSEMPFEITREMVEALPWLGTVPTLKTSLALLNDRGVTFEQIADLIEYRF